MSTRHPPPTNFPDLGDGVKEKDGSEFLCGHHLVALSRRRLLSSLRPVRTRRRQAHLQERAAAAAAAAAATAAAAAAAAAAATAAAVAAAEEEEEEVGKGGSRKRYVGRRARDRWSAKWLGEGKSTLAAAL